MEINREYRLKNISKSFDKLKLMEDFSISFPENKINCILGPSGCGKTTILNIISGLISPEKGDTSDFEKAELSYVFQEPRLLPWKTVQENIEFPLKDSFSKDKRVVIAKKYLRMVELDEFKDYYPHALSGGMKQRAALARAFAFPSKIILMDEPFKALDLKLKNRLTQHFLNLWKEDKRTVIFVTHDMEEAVKIGDSIKVLSPSPLTIVKEFTTETIDKETLRNEIHDLIN